MIAIADNARAEGQMDDAEWQPVRFRSVSHTSIIHVDFLISHITLCISLTANYTAFTLSLSRRLIAIVSQLVSDFILSVWV